jgi:hypothetical protein
MYVANDLGSDSCVALGLIEVSSTANRVDVSSDRTSDPFQAAVQVELVIRCLATFSQASWIQEGHSSIKPILPYLRPPIIAFLLVDFPQPTPTLL